MQITDVDREWLKKNYPDLQFGSGSDGDELVGDFRFCAAWDEQQRLYLINPGIEDSERLIVICDTYSVRILFSPNQAIPKLYEVNGRILGRAAKLGVPSSDLHIYATGQTCPIGVFEDEGVDSLVQFIDGPVLQFFYDQSYHERFGRWPRGQYSHGLFGMIESYHERSLRDRAHANELADQCLKLILAEYEEHRSSQTKSILDLLKSPQRVQGHQNCLCGSGKEFRRCHDSLFRGLWALREYVKGLVSAGANTILSP